MLNAVSVTLTQLPSPSKKTFKFFNDRPTRRDISVKSLPPIHTPSSIHTYIHTHAYHQIIAISPFYVYTHSSSSYQNFKQLNQKSINNQSMGVDYYNILKVNRTVSDEDLKKSYKKLAMKWHPDKNITSTTTDDKVAESKFKQISEAYYVLSDPKKRQIYDLYGEEGLKSGVYEESLSSSPMKSSSRFRFDPRDADEIFAEFFYGSDVRRKGDLNPKRSLRKAETVENKLSCSLEELYKGSKRKMQISRIVLDDSGYVCLFSLISCFLIFKLRFKILSW